MIDVGAQYESEVAFAEYGQRRPPPLCVDHAFTA
jgi:hypothetical protein